MANHELLTTTYTWTHYLFFLPITLYHTTVVARNCKKYFGPRPFPKRYWLACPLTHVLVYSNLFNYFHLFYSLFLYFFTMLTLALHMIFDSLPNKERFTRLWDIVKCVADLIKKKVCCRPLYAQRNGNLEINMTD